MTDKTTRDIVLGFILMGLALLGIFVLIPFGIVVPGEIEIQALAPDFWPLIITVGLGIAGAIVVVQGVVERRTGIPLPIAGEDVEEPAGEDSSTGMTVARLGTAMAALFVYYFSIRYGGVIVSSFTAIIVFTLLAGERRLRLILPIAVILPVFLYYFFSFVANVPMPLGVFESWR